MKRSLISVLSVVMLLASAFPGDAAIVELLRYQLGEPGSFVVNSPQDSVGSAHILNGFGFTPGGILDTAAPGSTSATRFTGPGSGAYGASSSGLPVDNFAIELWARSTNATQTFNDFFSLNGGTAGSVVFSHGGYINNSSQGIWAASISGIDYIGASGGAGQTAVDNVWTNLAIIRSNGISTFYIDGVAQAGTTNGTPSVGTDATGVHIGITPGGTSNFFGDLDEIRMFSFDPLVDDPVAALSFNNPVPEPRAFGMMALGVLICGLLLHRRKRSRTVGR
ncbi:MAG: LamG domain-containing protein [Pirellulales bacterium]